MLRQVRHKKRLVFVAVAAAAAFFLAGIGAYQQDKAQKSEINRRQALQFAAHTLSIDSVIQAYRAARRDGDLASLTITTELLQEFRYLKPSAQSFKVTFATPLSLYDTVDITSYSDVYELAFCRWLSTYENQVFFSDGVYVQSCGSGKLDLVIEI